MRTGQARKRDANEAAIVDALRAVGATVARLPGPFPDLLVGYCAGNWLLEVKTERGLKRKDQPEQQRWRDEWGGQVHIVSTPQEALRRVLGITATRK